MSLDDKLKQTVKELKNTKPGPHRRDLQKYLKRLLKEKKYEKQNSNRQIKKR